MHLILNEPHSDASIGWSAMQLDLMIEGQEGVSWEQWLALAEGCERHRIPTLFRSDHYLNLSGRHPERGSLDAWGLLCGLAAVTTVVRLGTLVSPVTFRHPSELARLAVTADRISGGRIEVGLGAGWLEREHAAHGFPYPDTRTRVDILEEQLEIVLGSWEPGPFSFTGSHYRLNQLDAQPKPIQRPHPPLIIGGSAGPRSCALAARFADEYNTAYATLQEVRERRARVTAACERAGREPIPFSLMTAVIAGRDAAELRERVARVAAIRDLSPGQLLETALPGWIIGDADEVLERLAALRDLGVSRVMCQHLAHDDVEFVELLGGVLAPPLA
jgi:alkanesulfonate monooxygenase SsuD/methylene tetrahydromethanopterin reductase-like flavin-dependent oxidoreductase (luciferase family)